MTTDHRLAWLLRVGVAACFIGHGAFGLLRKEEWLPYFQAFGIEPATALALMPLIGALDIAVGILALVRPSPLVLVYAAGWCLWTAALRPIAGEPVWETLERAGNYGVPLALLGLAGATAWWRSPRAWLGPVTRRTPADARPRTVVFRTLQATTATLLVGHAALALGGKPVLVGHAALLGAGPQGATLIGAVELGLAAAILLRPNASLFLLIAAWKVMTEALYPLAGAPVWEFVERGGSYVAPLGAALLLARSRAPARARVFRPAWLAVITAVCAGVAAPPAAAQRALPGLTPELLDALGRGGHILACRHAATDYSRPDAHPVDLTDPSTQRVLSDAGVRQAEAFGDALRRLRIPVGEVLASPYQRTFRSAELMFGRATAEPALFGRREPRRTRQLFTRPPEPGTNRALVTHQGVLYRVLDRPRGSIGEADCLVLRPGGDAPTLVAQVTPEEWARAVPPR